MPSKTYRIKCEACGEFVGESTSTIENHKGYLCEPCSVIDNTVRAQAYDNVAKLEAARNNVLDALARQALAKQPEEPK